MSAALTWLLFFQAVSLVLGVHLYFHLRDMLADFLAKDPDRPRLAASMSVANEKVVKGAQPVGARYAISQGLLFWALAALPLNLAAFWVPNFIWAVENGKGVGHGFLLGFAVPLFSALPACASYCVLMGSWLLPRRRTPGDAEEMQARLRSVLLDAVLLPPLYALWVAYQFPERFYVILAASPVYQGQTVVWMRFFWQSKRSALERAAAAVACGATLV